MRYTYTDGKTPEHETDGHGAIVVVGGYHLARMHRAARENGASCREFPDGAALTVWADSALAALDSALGC